MLQKIYIGFVGKIASNIIFYDIDMATAMGDLLAAFYVAAPNVACHSASTWARCACTLAGSIRALS